MAGWLGVAGRPAGWLDNLILMKTQSSAWTWTLDFDLGFVNTSEVGEISMKNAYGGLTKVLSLNWDLIL